MNKVIFVSAVSNEFHKVDPQVPHGFRSYRDELYGAFRLLAAHYEVVVQENLVQGIGDLLQTIDEEIERTLLVVHLIGEMAGCRPEADCVARLNTRHPDLLSDYPSLKAAIAQGDSPTYTQWEAYLALHHRRPCLVFEAAPNAIRSPCFRPNDADRASQQAHHRRIALAGVHRGTFCGQGDLARKAMRSFLHYRLDEKVDPVEPTEQAKDQAWQDRAQIVVEISKAIQKPDAAVVLVRDPANTAAFIMAWRMAAERWHVNLATIASISAGYEDELKAIAESVRTSEGYYNLAFAQLATGDYTGAHSSARQAAELARQNDHHVSTPVEAEAAINALMLCHETAKAALDINAAIATLEEAGSLVERNQHPVEWADIHTVLVECLLEFLNRPRLERARELLSDIVDIREDHEEDSPEPLAGALMLWCQLLFAQGKDAMVEGVAARAERIFRTQGDHCLPSVGTALAVRGRSLRHTGRATESEPLYREALAVFRVSLPSDHPQIATALDNLSVLLSQLGSLAEAEVHCREALEIYRRVLPSGHQDIAQSLNNLGGILINQGKIVEAVQMYHESLLISRKVLPAESPQLGVLLDNLAGLLASQGRPQEAEPLYKEALEIFRRAYPPGHPETGICLSNLTGFLIESGRPAEAEPLLREELRTLTESASSSGFQLVGTSSVLVSYLKVLHLMQLKDHEIREKLDEFLPLLSR